MGFLWGMRRRRSRRSWLWCLLSGEMAETRRAWRRRCLPRLRRMGGGSEEIANYFGVVRDRAGSGVRAVRAGEVVYGAAARDAFDTGADWRAALALVCGLRGEERAG